LAIKQNTFNKISKPLKEPVAWEGPIVMNKEKELEEAFDELDNHTFIKHAKPQSL
jgi:hypothetical protein